MTNRMKHDEVLYRGILEYERQPTKRVPDPNAPPTTQWSWQKTIIVPDGPIETITEIIGPYHSTKHIKSYVTRHRGYSKTNLRVVRFEKVTGWEECDG